MLTRPGWSGLNSSLRRVSVLYTRTGEVEVEPMHRLGPVSVFTLVDGQAVDVGAEVAGCKVTPVAVPAAVIEEAERISRAQAAVVQVVAFRPLRTLIVVTERLKPKARELFL